MAPGGVHCAGIGGWGDNVGGLYQWSCSTERFSDPLECEFMYIKEINQL